MAVNIVDGIPRSGKTYFGVKHLATKYYDRNGNDFTLKEKYQDVKIVTNIDALKLPHEDLNVWIDKAGGVDTLFSKKYQEKVAQKYPQIVYVIDEAQFYFPANYRNNEVFNWLQWHGHLGQDIYFLTQSYKYLPFGIYGLCESILHAKPSSFDMTGGRMLTYDWRTNAGEIVGTKRELKKQWVFNLYKSQDNKEVEKRKNPLLKFILVPIVLLLFSFYHSGWSFLPSTKERLENNSANDVQKLQPQSNTNPQAGSHLHPSQRAIIPVQTINNPAQEIRYNLDYIVEGSRVLIFYDGNIFDSKQFPYKLHIGPFNSLYAMIPEYLTPEFKAQQKPQSNSSSVSSTVAAFPGPKLQ